MDARVSLTTVPFVLGHGDGARRLAERSPLPGTAFLDVLDEGTVPFFRLLNAGNNHAFGGMGMPAWVQLDCCTLPTAMIGFAAPRAAVDDALWSSLLAGVAAAFSPDAARALDAYDGLVPLAEYCALPSLEPGVVVGFSLFSLAKGLGLRAKALSLLLLRARMQTGVAQYGNSAVKTHARLNPLTIVSARAAPHSLPEHTFIYRMEVPPPSSLLALAQGDVVDDEAPRCTDLVAVQDAPRFAADMLAGGRTVRVVAPGHVVVEDIKRITLLVESAR
jgi:hypothetical protein